MKKITFDPTAEDIAAEVAHLSTKGIEAYGSKHLILYPRIDEEQEVGGQKIAIGKAAVEALTKDLDIFFPVLLPAPRASADTFREPAAAGDFILPTARQHVVKVLHPTILAPVMEAAVYAFVEDYEVELVKRK